MSRKKKNADVGETVGVWKCGTCGKEALKVILRKQADYSTINIICADEDCRIKQLEAMGDADKDYVPILATIKVGNDIWDEGEERLIN